MTRPAIAAFALVALAACEQRAPDPEPSESAIPTPQVTATNSIFDPEAGVEPTPEAPEPQVETISFAKSGAELDGAARDSLDRLAAGELVGHGAEILIRGHSDAGGNYAVNDRISRQRAEAVRDYLAAKGVAEARMTVIAYGAQNPIEPNALPDGSPNEAGREANRRVEITVLPPDKPLPVEPEAE